MILLKIFYISFSIHFANLLHCAHWATAQLFSVAYSTRSSSFLCSNTSLLFLVCSRPSPLRGTSYLLCFPPPATSLLPLSPCWHNCWLLQPFLFMIYGVEILVLLISYRQHPLQPPPRSLPSSYLLLAALPSLHSPLSVPGSVTSATSKLHTSFHVSGEHL